MTTTTNKIEAPDRDRASRGLPGRLIAAAKDILAGDSDRSRLQRDALVAFFVRVLSAAILYFSQVVLARWMGTFEYGVYISVWTWVLVLGGLSNLGLATVMIRLIPEYIEKGELARLRGLLLYGRLTAFFAATLVALAAFAALKLFQPHVMQPLVLPAFLALACLPMIALGDLQDGMGRGGGWMAVALLPPYVLRPLLVLLAMVAAHEAGFQIAAETAIGAAVAACWLSVGLQGMLLRRKVKAIVPPGARERAPDLWLKTSLPLLGITGSELLIQNTDLLVIAHFLTPEQGAIYFAAAKTMALVLFVHYAVGSAVAKRFSALNARGDQAALVAFTRDAVNWTFWPSLAAAVLLLALGRPLLSLFGPKFVEGYPVMFILVAGFLGRSAMGPSEFLLNMLGQQKLCAAVVASMAALNIALQLVLVPRYGIIGAAAGTASVLILGALLNTVVARRKLGLNIAIWHNLRR